MVTSGYQDVPPVNICCSRVPLSVPHSSSKASSSLLRDSQMKGSSTPFIQSWYMTRPSQWGCLIFPSHSDWLKDGPMSLFRTSEIQLQTLANFIVKRENLRSGGSISLEALGTISTGDETNAWEQGQSPGCESQKERMRHWVLGLPVPSSPQPRAKQMSLKSDYVTFYPLHDRPWQLTESLSALPSPSEQ